MDNENFVNLRSQFFNKPHYSDLLLLIHDVAQPERQLQIHTHIVVLSSVSCYIASSLVPLLNHQNIQIASKAEKEALLTSQVVLKLQLDFSQSLSDEVVILFFSLFYVNRFDETHLQSQNLKEKVHYHILELYELASYFLFDALIFYIEQHLVSTMCLTYFSPLMQFSLLQSSGGDYHILDDKLSLFTRLLQWYQCCIEPSSPEAEQDYYVREKENIMTDLSRRVKNIEQCEIPRKSVISLDSLNTRLYYYHRICPACLDGDSKANRIGAFYYPEIGELSKTYRNARETFAFRLKRKLHSKQNISAVELIYQREYTQKRQRLESEIDWLEEEEGEYECTSQITLLSRKHAKDIIRRVYKEKDISVPIEIGSFAMHKEKYCYETECQHCHLYKPSYIILLDILLTRQVTSQVQEEMTMQIEDSSLCTI